MHFKFFQKISFLFCVLLTGCGGIVCKSKNHKLVIDYDPMFQTVDIATQPTYTKNSSWVKKIFVKTNGFLVVYDQKTVVCEEEISSDQLCKKRIVVSKYKAESYKEDVGYKFWSDIPKSDWIYAKTIDDTPSQKPSLHIPSCEVSTFGNTLKFLIDMLWAW